MITIQQKSKRIPILRIPILRIPILRIGILALQFFLVLWGLAVSVAVGAPLSAEEQIRSAQWHEREAGAGVVWKQEHFDNLFDSSQSLTVIDADLDHPGVAVTLLFAQSELKGTSAFAQETTGTVAAVNGVFFDRQAGGSVCFLRVNNKIIAETQPEKLDSTAIAINDSGDVSIIDKPQAGWSSVTDQRDIMAQGPLLVRNGVALSSWGDGSFFTFRHPRTAAGITASNHLILVTVDGRTPPAAGMSCAELARTMAALGCKDALNLDGGGSTTAWVRGEPFNGVVNFPSDNGKYDHQGERVCANAIAVLASPKQPKEGEDSSETVHGQSEEKPH